MKKYIVFCRVSTKKQDRARHGRTIEKAQDSLDIQERLCRRMVEEELGGTVLRPFYAKKSGRLYYSNEELQEALTIIDRKEANGIVFYDFERFSRNDYWPMAVRRIRRAGAELHFCCDFFPEGPEGELCMGSRAVAAKYLADKQRITAIRYLREYARDGVQMARSSAPFAYRIIQNADAIRDPNKMPGIYEIECHIKANLMKQVFIKRSKAKTLSHIATWLDGQIAPPGRAKSWSTTTVWNILHNPVYRGAGAYGRFQMELDEERIREGRAARFKVAQPEESWIYIPAPRIVTPKLWGKCQEINRRNSKTT